LVAIAAYRLTLDAPSRAGAKVTLAAIQAGIGWHERRRRCCRRSRCVGECSPCDRLRELEKEPSLSRQAGGMGCG
jgi:hypothetical protein